MPYGSNYSFVIDSSFQPFTMQEMLVPFAMYKDAFEKSEETYNDLKDKSDSFKYLADTLPEGSRARSIYEGYANDLNAQAQDLAQNGLNMSNRRALTGLKQRYQGEIGRLLKIDEIRKAQIKEQNALRLQDPTRMFSRRADLTDFDQYLDNPDLNYESYSGALLAQQVGTAAGAIAKGLNDAIKTGKLDDYTKTWIESRGYNVEDVRQAMLDPSSDKTGVLSSIVRDAVESSGIPQWGDVETLSQAYKWANQGLWQAIGQSQVHTFEDYGARLSAQEAKEKRMADYNSQLRIQEAQKIAEGQQNQLKGSLAINPINIYSQKEMDDTARAMKDYAQYFTTDAQGRTMLNKDGIKEYNRNAAPHITVAGSGGGTAALMNAETQMQNKETFVPTEFKKFIDSIGGADYIKKRQYGNLGNLWNQYNQEHKSSKYDATKSTEFDFSLDSTQQQGMKDAILSASRGAKLREVDFDRKSNTFKPTGGTLSLEEFNKSDYTIVSSRFSPYGSIIMVKDKTGKTHRYEMPREINPVNEAARDQAMANVNILQKAISEYSQNGYYTDAKGNRVTPTEEQALALYAKYQEELQRAYLHHSQIGLLQNKTKEQEYNPYGF